MEERRSTDVIRNVHERRLDATPAEVGAVLDTLASANDRLWPSGRWPAMRFERPLDVRVPAEPLRAGAGGGHGPIRYQVSRYVPGRQVVFSFCPASGLDGEHRFEVVPEGGATVLRHVLEARPIGRGRLSWPLVMRPLHDALIEDALDRAERAVGGRPRRRWSPRVALLRALFGITGSSSASSPEPATAGPAEVPEREKERAAA
jgi:hypothetical protein